MEIDPPDDSDGAPPPNKQQRSDVVNNTGQAESRNVDLSISLTARADRARSDSFDFASHDAGFTTVTDNKRKLVSRNKTPSSKDRMSDGKLVLLIDNVSLLFSNKNKVQISKEVARIAPGAILTGIFYLARGGIKIVCANEESVKCILESQHWGSDAFGGSAKVGVPKSLSSNPAPSKKFVWNEASKCYVDPVKVVLSQVPRDYSNEDICNSFKDLGVVEVKCLPVVSGSGAIPQRLLTFKDADAAASSLAERWSFLLDGFAFKGRYLKVSLPPVQCKRCQKFGHAATACSVEQVTCSRCGAVGHSDSSPSCSVVDKENSRCINCKGNHPAWSFKCPAFKEAQKVAVASVKKDGRRDGFSYSTAARSGLSQAAVQPTQSSDVAKIEKLVGAFISMLVMTKVDQDPRSVVDKSIKILSRFAPEFLQSSIVKESLEVVLKAATPRASKSGGNSNKVGTGQKC